MRQWLVSFLSGGLFAWGLGIAGMTRPEKVVGFLDLTGNWDASLAFVMLGAVTVHALLQRWILKRPRPLLAERFQLPSRRDLDLRLIGGSALFGVGWALGGFCPGPGLVAGASGGPAALVFVGGMSGGVLLTQALVSRRSAQGGEGRPPSGG